MNEEKYVKEPRSFLFYPKIVHAPSSSIPTNWDWIQRKKKPIFYVQCCAFFPSSQFQAIKHLKVQFFNVVMLWFDKRSDWKMFFLTILKTDGPILSFFGLSLKKRISRSDETYFQRINLIGSVLLSIPLNIDKRWSMRVLSWSYVNAKKLVSLMRF